jgi:hypothetical protein
MESDLDINMQKTLQELQKQILKLPIRDRWQLVQTLLESLQRETQNASSTVSQWSEAVISYEGIPDFPAFESYRDELLLPCEPDLF